MQINEIKLYCPLQVKTDPDSVLAENYGDCPNEFELATIPNSVAQHYNAEILAALEKEMHTENLKHGLVPYLDADSTLASKVDFIWPSVEICDNELWGVMQIRLNQELSPAEFTELTEYCVGQMADGLGEGIEQHPIHTPDGDLYVSFWQSGKDYSLKPEQEFKAEHPEPEQSFEQTMGGM